MTNHATTRLAVFSDYLRSLKMLVRVRCGRAQGHIALDSAVFPEGTPGLALDTLARAPLWSIGLNYRHGTGHGVGAALNVHEGPQSISARCG